MANYFLVLIFCLMFLGMYCERSLNVHQANFMRSEYESKFGYIYGIVLILVLGLVAAYILCDFNTVIPKKWCINLNSYTIQLTEWVNGVLGI